MQETLLHVSNVYKSYGKSAVPSLDGISFTVAKGEIVGIFGPNGAGKTTLISILCSILEPTLGSVVYRLDGEKSPREIRSKLGFVPQDFSFFPELTAKQNLSYFGNLYDLKKEELEQKIDELLKKLEDEDRQLIQLFYLEEMSIKEVVEITGLTESNVKIKLFRARKYLAEHTSQYFEIELENL